MPYYIYINGYPGVGKFTVANELQRLLPDSKVYHNHLLIDPVAPIVERTFPNYHAARTSLRRHILDIVATIEDAQSTTWIFTDSRSTSPHGITAAEDYKNAAKKRGVAFIPVVLHCDLDENIKRIADEKRSSGRTTKLMDGVMLRSVRKEEQIHHFGGQYEMQLDITPMSPAEAARAIVEHIGKIDSF